jgi:undecaprenyl-phosphate 4-deoxy-4-formamido-L-arabinose transferase
MAFDGLLSIVIPVYRSEAYLARTVAELVAFFEPIARFEVILVNDGSPDRVAQVIDRLCAEDARVRAISLGRNIGQHRATLRGFALARGDVVVTVDDDGQNPPAAALAVAEALVAGDLDVAYGRFQSVEQTGLRRLASRANRWLSRRTIQNWSDVAITNVRALRGDLARALGAVDSPYPYIDALVFRMTRHIGEVPVEHRARGAGESTYTLGRLLKLWVSHLTSLTILPLQFAMVGSFGVSVLGFLLGAGQLVRVLVERKAPAGWLSLYVTVTFLFSVLFAFLGIISAYLGRMYVSLNERDLVWTRSHHLGERAAPARPELPAARRTGSGGA